MPEFLSPAWLRAVDQALRADAALAAAVEPGAPLTIAYQVGEGPAAVRYHVRLAPEGCRAGAGTDDADVTFRTDPTTAAAIARGERRAQRAFMSGALHATGEIGELLGRADLLAALDRALRPVAASTTYRTD